MSMRAKALCDVEHWDNHVRGKWSFVVSSTSVHNVWEEADGIGRGCNINALARCKKAAARRLLQAHTTAVAERLLR